MNVQNRILNPTYTPQKNITTRAQLKSKLKADKQIKDSALRTFDRLPGDSIADIELSLSKKMYKASSKTIDKLMNTGMLIGGALALGAFSGIGPAICGAVLATGAVVSAVQATKSIFDQMKLEDLQDGVERHTTTETQAIPWQLAPTGLS